VAVGRIFSVGEQGTVGIVVPFRALTGFRKELLLFNGVDGQAAK
jgi:hypothetical protein